MSEHHAAAGRKAFGVKKVRRGGNRSATPHTTTGTPTERAQALMLAEAARLARDIHQTLKRGERTQDHGLIGNLGCILDHVCRKYDPPPI